MQCPQLDNATIGFYCISLRPIVAPSLYFTHYSRSLCSAAQLLFTETSEKICTSEANVDGRKESPKLIPQRTRVRCGVWSGSSRTRTRTSPSMGGLILPIPVQRPSSTRVLRQRCYAIWETLLVRRRGGHCTGYSSEGTLQMATTS